MIRIDKQHLEKDPAEKILNTLFHEIFHSWEFCLVYFYVDCSDAERKLCIFSHCEEYLDEIINIILNYT